MKFGIFDHLEGIQGTPLPQLYKERLELVKLADEGGITGYHLAEHHGTDLCLAPMQEPFLAAASAVTTKIRVGPLVKLLPLHHPLAVIQELVSFDNLTDGRVDFGVGRGVVPSEHLFFDQPWQHARERFEEVLGIVLEGLRTGRITSDGRKFFNFPPMETAMLPVQTPNPATSAASLERPPNGPVDHDADR
jgi:alkanesulfonate monooxygenase SsuD/methylene tetrahydromethanopterin reductase-like flavin-dependent oxidoreductase (luciferase family)